MGAQILLALHHRALITRNNDLVVLFKKDRLQGSLTQKAGIFVLAF